MRTTAAMISMYLSALSLHDIFRNFIENIFKGEIISHEKINVISKRIQGFESARSNNSGSIMPGKYIGRVLMNSPFAGEGNPLNEYACESSMENLARRMAAAAGIRKASRGSRD